MIKKFKNFSEPEVKIEYYSNGQKKSEIWKLNGIKVSNLLDQRRLLHREDGPTYQSWYENGQKEYEVWNLNGKWNREDGPAYQKWFYNGQKQYEVWYLNGKIHKEDGYAYQLWYGNGQKEVESWYLNNKQYSREEWINELKNIGSKHYDEQNLLYNIEKYNL